MPSLRLERGRWLAAAQGPAWAKRRLLLWLVAFWKRVDRKGHASNDIQAGRHWPALCGAAVSGLSDDGLQRGGGAAARRQRAGGRPEIFLEHRFRRQAG